MTNKIKVLIVDDHEMVREGLSTILRQSPDMELVGQASDGDFAVMMCSEHCPDVVLMDLLMPEMDGITAIGEIQKHCSDTQIIALTTFGDQERIQAALAAGAIGYLLKNVPSQQLLDAIRNAHAGKSTLSPEAAQVLIQASISSPPPGYDLTERELEVLALLVDGQTNAQIAQALEITLSTAKFHVSTILSKLDVSSRTEAVSLALKQGIIKQK